MSSYLPARRAPLLVYVLFLVVGHPLAMVAPGSAGVAVLVVLAMGVPAATLLERGQESWWLWATSNVVGAATFVAGLTWLLLLPEPSNDVRPVIPIVVGHLTMITSAGLLARETSR